MSRLPSPAARRPPPVKLAGQTPPQIAPVMGAGYHTIHHTLYNYNYGHYFTFVDRWAAPCWQGGGKLTTWVLGKAGLLLSSSPLAGLGCSRAAATLSVATQACLCVAPFLP